MAKGLYLMPDGQVLVEYGRRRRVPIPPLSTKQMATARHATNFRLKLRGRSEELADRADGSPRKQGPGPVTV